MTRFSGSASWNGLGWTSPALGLSGGRTQTLAGCGHLKLDWEAQAMRLAVDASCQVGHQHMASSVWGVRAPRLLPQQGVFPEEGSERTGERCVSSSDLAPEVT